MLNMHLFYLTAKSIVLVQFMLLMLLAGCSHVQLRDVTGHYEGLRSAFINDKRIKLLMIHGVGHHKPGYAQTLLDEIAREMGMEPEFKFAIHEIKNELPLDESGRIRTFGYLRVQDYKHVKVDQVMRTYELTWSPTTQPVKDQFLGYDSQGKSMHQRIFLNQMLKDQIMNERLAEAVLYVGKYRKHMQFPIKWAMNYVLEDPFGDDADQIVIITSSLASYMVMDTITQLNPAEENMLNIDELFSKLDSVIMLANQMPLLLLSEVTQIGDHLGDPPDFFQQNRDKRDGDIGSWFSYPVVRHLVDMRIESILNRYPGIREIPELNLVAINDPNDLLSYNLPGYLDLEQDYVNYVNVVVNIARITPVTQIANPITAHQGHAQNADVIDFIVHGKFEEESLIGGFIDRINPLD